MRIVDAPLCGEMSPLFPIHASSFTYGSRKDNRAGTGVFQWSHCAFAGSPGSTQGGAWMLLQWGAPGSTGRSQNPLTRRMTCQLCRNVWIAQTSLKTKTTCCALSTVRPGTLAWIRTARKGCLKKTLSARSAPMTVGYVSVLIVTCCTRQCCLARSSPIKDGSDTYGQ